MARGRSPASLDYASLVVADGRLDLIYESIHKWMTGLHLENLGYGSLLTAAATLINGALGGYLVWLGR